MNKVTQAIYGVKGLFKSQINQMVASELVNLGADMLLDAIRSKRFANRTGNLVSSYGACVYNDGKEWMGKVDYSANALGMLDTSSYPARLYSNEGLGRINKQRHNPIEGVDENGYEALDRFFGSYKAPKGKWQLVLVAAMFYGSAVEARGYQVISQIGAELQMSDVARKYGGLVKDVPNKWNV